MNKILISIPTIDQNIDASLVGRLLEWNAKHYIGFLPIIGVQPIDKARNIIVEEFLKTDCTHLMMIDADTVPPSDTLDKLLLLNKPFTSALTPIIDGQNAKIRKYNAVDIEDKEIKPNTGIFQSRGVGASCLLLKREIFEKIKPPYFRFIFQDDFGKECFVSEDIYFISKCLQKDIIPYIDSSLLCKHFKKALF